MTKEQWIDLTIDFLSGGDQTEDTKGKYHPEIVSKHLNLAFTTLIEATYKQNLSYGDFSELDAFTRPYENVAVQTGVSRDKKYSQMPVAVVNLPDNRGIRQISPMKDESTSYAYMESVGSPVFFELEVSEVSDVPTFYVEQNNIIYVNMSDDTDTVLMKLIPSFEALNDTDEVSIPGGKDKIIFDMVAQTMLNKPPEDTINDKKVNQV